MARSPWLRRSLGAVASPRGVRRPTRGVLHRPRRAACGASTRRDPPPSGAGGTRPATEPTDPPAPADPSRRLHGEPPEPARRSSWRQVGEDTGAAILEVPVDYDDPDGETFELFVARRLAEDQDNKIGSLLVNPGGPGFGGSRFRRCSPSSSSVRSSSSASTSSGGIPAGPATASRRSTASTTTTTITPAPTSRPTTRPSASRSSTSPRTSPTAAREQRRHHRARRHEQQRQGHGLAAPGAGRGRDQLLRVQLRQRARRHVGDAVPGHRARRGARRGRRPHRRPAADGCSRPRASSARWPPTSRRAATTRRAPSTTMATPRVPSTR